jgi:hypothetical protein
MPRHATAAQARERPINTESCFSALESFAAAGDLEELARQHVRCNSSSTSSWLDTLKAVDDALANGTKDEHYLLSAALFKPLASALANALQLLAPEGSAALLSEVCAACSLASVFHNGLRQC